MKSHILYNDFHLGDCLVALHLLRALAKYAPDDQFSFFTHGCNLPQLADVVMDVPNIFLFDFENPMWPEERHRAVNTWKNHLDAWVNSPLRWKWADYTLWHHGVVARQLGFESPFTRREHLLFDYPALEMCLEEDEEDDDWPYDFLIGDSAPNSGQYQEWADHSKNPMEVLVTELKKKWRVVLTSELKAEGKTITEIGRLSQVCKHHVMVANAPFFVTMNTHNHHCAHGRSRIALLDNGEKLGMPYIDQCGNVVAVCEIARQERWIE